MKPLNRTSDGFLTADETEFMGEVARRVNDRAPALAAHVEHTGGGIFCVVLSLPRGWLMYWGTSAETWGADVCDREGELVTSVFSDVPTRSDDAVSVAHAIVALAEKMAE